MSLQALELPPENCVLQPSSRRTIRVA